MANITDKERKLAPIVKRYKPGFARFFQQQKNLFLAGFERLRSQFPELQEAGTPPGVIPDWSDIWEYVALHSVGDINRLIESLIMDSMQVAGLKAVPLVAADISFTLANPVAVRYIATKGAELVADVDRVTKGHLAAIIRDGVKAGDSYGTIAERIRNTFDGFSGLKPQAHIVDRAELIAVTESGNAYGESTLIQANAMQAAGLPMEKRWATVGDYKVSDGCKENEEAGWIPIDEVFPSGDMRPLRFPGCRCNLQTRMKED